MRNAPTFIVFGASRSGTTGLYTYLKQHPEIYMSPAKETNFFAYGGNPPKCTGPGADYVNKSVVQLEDYEALFADAGSAKARGEASPLYLYEPGTAERIHARLPDVKLIAILRNPVEQAYSHFLYARRQMLEPLADFNAALDAEQSRVDQNWQPMFRYARFPRYAEQLARYYSVFTREQIQIHLYEDFEERPQEVMKAIFRFIGVDDAFEPDVDYRPNAGGLPRNKTLQDLIMKPTPLSGLFSVIPADLRRRVRDRLSGMNMTRDECPPVARRRLVAALSDDIRALGPIIGRDVSHWLRG